MEFDSRPGNIRKLTKRWANVRKVGEKESYPGKLFAANFTFGAIPVCSSIIPELLEVHTTTMSLITDHFPAP